MRYQMQEGWLELPQKWEDRTINMLVCYELPISNVNIVVTRDPMPKDTDFDSHIQSLLKIFKEKMESFKLVSHSKGDASGRPSHFIEIGWVDKGKFVSQMVLYILEKKMLIAITATVPGGMDVETEKELIKILKSYRFNGYQNGKEDN